MDDKADPTGSGIDVWLVPPDNAAQARGGQRRRHAMRLMALFDEFSHYLRVEQEATRRTIQTYRYCFGDFMALHGSG